MHRLDGMTVNDLVGEIEEEHFENGAGVLRNFQTWKELKTRLKAAEDLNRSNSWTHYMVSAVHRFNQEIVGLPIPERPTPLSKVRKDFALKALREEVDEFEGSSDLDGEVDALIDLTYYALGRLVEMGISPYYTFELVHEANMRRVRGERGREKHSLGYDARKPEGWRGPDLVALLGLSLEDARRVMREKLVRPDEVALETVVEFEESVRRPKLLILGYGRHGKDTVCEMLRDDYGLKFQSSSMFCAERVLMPYFNAHPDLPSYTTVEDCYNDRHSKTIKMGTRPLPGPPNPVREVEAFTAAEYDHRTVWFEQIEAYNKDDWSRLAREMMETNDVYCGMRSAKELIACKAEGVFDAIIWVDRSKHVLPESESSCTVTQDMADIILDNNGSLDDLRKNLRHAMSCVNSVSYKTTQESLDD